MTPEPSTACPDAGSASPVAEPPEDRPQLLTTHAQHPTPTTKRPSRHWRRRLLESVLLFTCVLLLLRALIVEPYSVPTGSMAPVLAGIHKATACPRCAYPVLVGHRDDRGDVGQRSYERAACPNCGCASLDLDSVRECPGDQLLVDKNGYVLRRPHRWELTVFRYPGDPARSFIKRVVGLPGEHVQIRNGDVYIDRFLSRKTLDEFRAVRIPVFDNNYQPAPDGWRCRWLSEPDQSKAVVEDTTLRLDTTRLAERRYHWLIYRHVALDDQREQPVTDGYGYNGGLSLSAEPVYDFQIECDVEVVRGEGWIALGLDDGQDVLLAELRVGPARQNTFGTCLSDFRDNNPDPIRTAPSFFLSPGRTYHVEFAFVDRRATVTVDGVPPFAPLDLPAAEKRNKEGVRRPARIGAVGVEAIVQNIRLYRDIHYTQAGQYGTQKPVRLLAGKYFVLGDNSPNSDDSRYWGSVPESHFVGKPFVIHLPSRIVEWDGFGRHWQHRWPSGERMRWLH